MTSTLPRPGLARVARSMAALEIVRDEAGFRALEPFWDALVEQMATRSPFLRWDWISLWWEECRPKDARLAIGVLRDKEGVPMAIAPLMLAREPDHARRHLVALGFLAGFGEAHGERLDLIIPAGREAELAPRLCAVFKMLRHECDVVRLNHLPLESPGYPHLFAALKAGYKHAGVMNRHACRFTRLPATWEEYEARHSGTWRNQLRRRRRAFHESPAGGRTSLTGEHLSSTEAMRRLGELHAMNWPEDVSTFLTPASWRFHRRLAERWLPQQRAIMPLLESGGEVIAAIYGFIERDEFFQYQMGWSPACSRLSPGRLVIRACIEASIQRGLRVHDMLPSDYEYKRQWCPDVRWLVDLEGCNATSWRASAFHALRRLRRLFSPPQSGLRPKEENAS